MGGGDDVCGSLEDWLHPLPTFEDSELPPHMRAIFNKHKDIHAAELKGALSSFGSLLEGIYRKRMGLMLSEASKDGFRTVKQKLNAQMSLLMYQQLLPHAMQARDSLRNEAT
ncbi:hypothetical protein ZWY2020_033274 [Hordeum vulgare]|nr:hypothetical protein ZWY2020_033274 [Hordeum vulgare]